MNEVTDLKQRVEKLEQIINSFIYPDRFQFDKTVQHRGNQLGFYSNFPIKKPSSSGTTLNMTTVGGVAVTEANGFSGNTGTTFYTIGDLVKHLKALGLLTA